MDMYSILGKDAIWRGLRDLYAKSLIEDDADDLKERLWTSNMSGKYFNQTLALYCL